VELCLRSGILVWGLVWRDCDEVCGPLCLSMLPDVFKGAGGTMRSRKTHISGMSSLVLRRASVTYSLTPYLTDGVIHQKPKVTKLAHRWSSYPSWIPFGLLLSGPKGNIFEIQNFTLPSWIK
jgi:hypothetical protein